MGKKFCNLNFSFDYCGFFYLVENLLQNDSRRNLNPAVEFVDVWNFRRDRAKLLVENIPRHCFLCPTRNDEILFKKNSSRILLISNLMKIEFSSKILTGK